MAVRAEWNGRVLAESDRTVVVDGCHYFPPDAIRFEFIRPSSVTSSCPWKGKARHLAVVIDGQTADDIAWSYPEPSAEARRIAGYVAFRRMVTIREV